MTLVINVKLMSSRHADCTDSLDKGALWRHLGRLRAVAQCHLTRGVQELCQVHKTASAIVITTCANAPDKVQVVARQAKEDANEAAHRERAREREKVTDKEGESSTVKR